jgi:hypothetical protein
MLATVLRTGALWAPTGFPGSGQTILGLAARGQLGFARQFWIWAVLGSSCWQACNLTPPSWELDGFLVRWPLWEPWSSWVCVQGAGGRMTPGEDLPTHMT